MTARNKQVSADLGTAGTELAVEMADAAIKKALGMDKITFTPSLHDGKSWTADENANLKQLVYMDLDTGSCGSLGGWVRPDVTKLVRASPDLLEILDELDGRFDEQLYAEKAREDFDAPDDREYSVNITAKQLRAIAAALNKATR